MDTYKKGSEERRNNEMMLQLHQLLINYKESTNSKWSRMEETLRSVVQELRGISDALNKKEQEECDVGKQQLIPVLGLQEQHSEGPPVFDEDPNKEDYDLEEQKIILEALEIQEVQAKGPQTPIIALELFDESSKEEEINEESELAEKYAVQGCSTIHFFAEGDHKPDYGQRTKDGIVSWNKKKVRPGIYTITTADDMYQQNRDTLLEIMMFDSSHDWGGDNQAASELVKTEVEPILEQCRPMISSMKFYELTLGTVVLQFTGVFISEAGCDDGFMKEMAMQWEGIRVSVALHVQVKNIAFNGVFRLICQPLVEELPCFGAVSFSLRLKKKLDFTLKVISGDISAMPGISVDLVVVIVSATCGVVLTLLDNLYLKSSHSIFFNSLRTRGFKLDFKLAEDPNLTLQRYGQYWKGALILFSPTTNRFGGSLNLVATLDFADSGHDVIVAADEDATNLIRNIAAECGIDFDEDFSTMVLDHISYAISEIDGDQTLIAADDSIQSDVMLESARIEAPVLFKRVRHSLNPANRLVLKVLSGSSSSYPANPKQKLSTPPALTRSTISLVSIVHARNNARILFSGSLDLFSNSFFKSSASMGNLQLCGYDAFPLCSTSPSPWPERSKSQGNKLSTEDIILIAVRVLLVVLLLLCYILACCLFRKRIESSTKDGKAVTRAGPKSGDRRVPPTASEVETGGNGGNGGKLVHFDRPIVFTAEDLLCATVEIMGKSTYGIVYKGALEDGSQVAVKSLREKLTKNQEEFEMEVNRSGKIRNPNLLAMRTYYLGPKGEKLIAFDYMPKGKSGRPEIDKSKRPEYQEGSRKSVTIYIYDPGGNFSYPQGILLSVSTGLQKLTQQEVGRSKSNHEDMVDFQGGRIVRIALEDQYLLVVHAKVVSIGATTAVSQAKGVMT